MPEKTKPNKDFEKPAEHPDGDSSEELPKDTWEADQRTKSYYYDDDHGYELYDPDADEED